VQKASNNVDQIVKQDKTKQPIYRNSQTTANNLLSLQAPTTGAPLPRGNVLVAYENRKWEKKCVGKKNGLERMCGIKVVSA
jgi:hypothetical protein